MLSNYNISTLLSGFYNWDHIYLYNYGKYEALVRAGQARRGCLQYFRKQKIQESTSWKCGEIFEMIIIINI